MSKKRINIKFVDFWNGFDPSDCIFMTVLREHYDVHLCNDGESADYVIHSVFGSRILKEGGVKIFYTGELEEPNFNISDYAVSYSKCSYGDRNFYLRNHYFNETYKNRTLLAEKKHLGIIDIESLNKTDFCSFVVSNGRGDDKRRLMFDALNRYKQVNSGGRYLNNIGGLVDDKIKFESTHKFSICFENCSYPGYTTEKLVEAFAAQTIPIYWGNPEVHKVFNKRAFIDIMDYPSIESVVERVIEIDNDDNLYLDMLKEPIWISDVDNYQSTRLRFSSWLCNIVNQSVKKAYRAPTGYWNDHYLWKLRDMQYAYEHPYKSLLKPILNKIQR